MAEGKEQDNPTYLDPYRKAIARHGAGFAATLWGSREAQHLRFDVMIDLAGFEQCTILDIGCGDGDFAAHLLQRKVPFKRYVGIDAIEEMIERARQRNLDRAEFHAGDVLSMNEGGTDGDNDADPLQAYEADYICFSGTLNTMDEQVARQLLERAFAAAAQGIVFNFLSDRYHSRWADRDMYPARRFSTTSMLDWAMGLTSRVAFTQVYMDGHDATMLMLHDGE